MTSLPTIPASAPQELEGRSARDVVEYSPEQVNDAWCRKVLRKILQSLELQYAMQMPHRAITPDTVAFHANGEPLLITDDIDAAPAPDTHLADDLTALAGVIHFAITRELIPAGPLYGRAPGYSAGLIAAVDACMDPDPVRRPQRVDAVRGMLDIVAPAPLAGAIILPEVSTPPALPPSVPVSPSAFPPANPDTAVDMHRAGRRWAFAAGCGAIAIALALVVFTTVRAPRASDHSVPPVPQAANRPQPPGPAPSVATVAEVARPGNAAPGTAGDETTDTAGNAAGNAASGGSSGGATAAGGGADVPVPASEPASLAPRIVSPRAGAPTVAPATREVAEAPGAVSGDANYQLQIKPWGVVYVDGVERGVSPPIKRLALTPGRHTVRITHPNYRDSILEFNSAQTTSNGKIIVDFEREDQ